MSLILNIDTALENNSLCLAKDGSSIAFAQNEKKQDERWPHEIITGMLRSQNLRPSSLSAIAVSIGPGSYTGLRVGLSAAKGLCFALNIPLIAINTLELMAFAVKEEAQSLICPVIDARRMEIFTAVYDRSLAEIWTPRALIIDKGSFESILDSRVLFCGNGIQKLKDKIISENAYYSETISDATHLAVVSELRYQQKKFADLAYTEPFYLKEFYTGIHNL